MAPPYAAECSISWRKRLSGPAETIHTPCRLILYLGSEGCKDVGGGKQSTAECAASKKNGEQEQNQRSPGGIEKAEAQGEQEGREQNARRA